MTTAQQRKKQERGERRRRIQESAREIVQANGFARSSIERVARRASLSVGAIYLYFRSKEDLYLSLLEDPLSSLAAELAEIRARGDSGSCSTLQAAWAGLTAWSQNRPDNALILRMLAQPGIRSRLSTQVIESLSGQLAAVRDELAAMVTSGIEAGIYRRVDPRGLAEIIWSMFMGLTQTADISANLSGPGELMSASSQAAFEAIEAGLRIPVARVAEAA